MYCSIIQKYIIIVTIINLHYSSILTSSSHNIRHNGSKSISKNFFRFSGVRIQQSIKFFFLPKALDKFLGIGQIFIRSLFLGLIFYSINGGFTSGF